MKIGKEAAFAEKHRAKQKAIRRFVKERDMIFPGILASAFLFGLLGGTIAQSIDSRFAMAGAMIGSWVGVVLSRWLILGGR